MSWVCAATTRAMNLPVTNYSPIAHSLLVMDETVHACMYMHLSVLKWMSYE